MGLNSEVLTKILKAMSVIYARLTTQYKYKYQAVISARNDKQKEDGQILIEIELNITLKIDHNLTETDLDNINVRFASEEQIQRQELKDSGWRFDTNNSMAIYFYKTGKMTGTSYVKPL